jgi:penicillin amidase
MLRAIGDGSFDPGARARQIRDGLLAVERATPADMLKIQLDDRALFLSRWRDLALGVLTPDAVAVGGSEMRGEFRRLLQETWTGHASIDSVAYRLVRAFRLTAADLALQPLLAPALGAAPTSPALPPNRWVSTIEGPLWMLVSEQPLHLLDARYRNWNDLLLDAIDRTTASLTEGGRSLATRSWGEANTALIGHPLSGGIPLAWRWLDMPRDPLPGDSNLPRVQSPSGGASERFGVSPGYEAEGYFHMPDGQSGHPLSPHYRDGHRAWVKGEPTPFLPGPAINTLVMTPD